MSRLQPPTPSVPWWPSPSSPSSTSRSASRCPRSSPCSGQRPGSCLPSARWQRGRGCFGRFPVYDKTIDNVVGVLSTKDLLGVAARNAAANSRQGTSLRRLIRPPIVVPQGASVTEVLARVKANRQPMAVVLDEYGGTAGVVTLKDLVERLLGSVGDEYTPAAHEIRALADG